MTSLSEILHAVIGVGTHVATHSAAVVDARTGGVLGELTVEATPEGYQQLVDFAGEHTELRAWAVEGTGGHGAGLARLLARRYELVLELDRPERAKRRNGAKPDPLDAIRAAREALSRAKLGTPRCTGRRQALSVLLAARRPGGAGRHRRPAADVQPGDRRPRMPAAAVPRPQTARHAPPRRAAADQPPLGRRDSHHRPGAARPGWITSRIAALLSIHVMMCISRWLAAIPIWQEACIRQAA